jgi:hypothetical protein
MPVCPVLRAIPHLGGKAEPHRTLAGGADLLAWHMSPSGCQAQMVGRFSRLSSSSEPDLRYNTGRLRKRCRTTRRSTMQHPLHRHRTRRPSCILSVSSRHWSGSWKPQKPEKRSFWNGGRTPRARSRATGSAATPVGGRTFAKGLCDAHDRIFTQASCFRDRAALTWCVATRLSGKTGEIIQGAG